MSKKVGVHTARIPTVASTVTGHEGATTEDAVVTRQPPTEPRVVKGRDSVPGNVFTRVSATEVSSKEGSGQRTHASLHGMAAGTTVRHLGGFKNVDVLPHAAKHAKGVQRTQQVNAQMEHLARMDSLAHLYGQLQRNYNGARRDEVIARNPVMAAVQTGSCPYWDVDPSQEGLHLPGDFEHSPYCMPDGKVRLFSHYQATKEHAALEARFGKPTGTVEAEMTCSYRTLILHPTDGVPFQMKFSSPEDEEKKLTADNVNLSVIRSQHLSKESFVIPESAGLILDGIDLTSIYRPISVPSQRELQDGDVLINWPVMMSPEFRDTALGKQLFAAHGGYESWCRTQLVPRVADILERCFLDSFTHYELHSQNVDVLMDATGNVLQVLIKDLMDMKFDPAAQVAATGQVMDDLEACRKTYRGHVGQWVRETHPYHWEDEQGIRDYYGSYFTQFGMDARGHRSATSELRQWAVEELVNRVRQRFDVDTFKAYPEHATVFGPLWQTGKFGDECNVLDALRVLLIKAQLEKRFQPDDSVIPEFQKAGFDEGVASSTVEDACGLRWMWFNKRELLEWGRVGNVPAALTRKDGKVDSFFFLFPTQCRVP